MVKKFEPKREQHTKLLFGVKVIDTCPRVVSATSNQATGITVNGSTGNVVVEIDLLQQSAWLQSIEEIDTLSSCNSENAGVVWTDSKTVEFTGPDCPVNTVLYYRMTRAQIPPPDLAVFSGSSHNVVVLVPDDGLDGTAVDARSDLVASNRVGAISTRRGEGRRGAIATTAARATRQVKDTKLFLGTTCSQDLGVGLDRKCNGPYNVGMLQRMQAFACVCVPDFTVNTLAMRCKLGETERFKLTLRSLQQPWLKLRHRLIGGLAKQHPCGLRMSRS